MEIAATIKQIAFVGDHLPRQCGIATFTADICEAIATEISGMPMHRGRGQ